MASSASFGEVITRFGSDISGFSAGIAKMQAEARAFERDMNANASKLNGTFGGMGKSSGSFASAVAGHAEKVTSGFKSMLSGALSFATGQLAVNAVGGALGFLKDQFSGVLQESMDAQAGMALTTTVLKSTGDASGMTAQGVADLAGNLSHLTTFSDDTVQAAENMLLTFTNIGHNVFPQATKTVLDMSQALGQDTKSSAIQLGKALNDPIAGITALSRVGVTFSQTQKDTIAKMMATNNLAGAQGIILKELQREFGGAAEAAGKTFGGQMVIAKQRLADVKQTIGDALLPILTSLLTTINTNLMPVIERFGSFLAANVIPVLGKWASALVGSVGPALQMIISALGGAAAFIEKLGAAFTITQHNFISWGGALFFLRGIISQVVNAITGAFGPALDAIREKVGPLLAALGNVANAMGGALALALRSLSNALAGVNVVPFATSLASLASGAMNQLISGLNWLARNLQVLTPLLAGLGAILATVIITAVVSLATAVWGLAAGVIAATWPLLAIGAAVAGLVAIFMHFYTTNAGFKAFIDVIAQALRQLWSTITANIVPAFQALGTFMQSVVMPILQRVGAFLISTFKPVWDQLVSTIQQQLIPVWNNLVQAIQPLLPQLKIFGQFLIGTLAVAITLIISVIGGLLHALASALSGIISIFGGIVEVISGAIKVITGIISFFVDLATGKFDKLGSDLGTIMNGIGTMFHGVWEIIKGIFQTVIGAIVGFVAGFIQTIVGIFQALSDKLVGHSIIPEMVAAILGFFTNLVNTGGNLFNSLGTNLHNIMENVKAGMSAAWNWIVTTVVVLVTRLWNTITQKAAQIRDTFLSAFFAIRDGIGSIVRAMANNAIGQLNGMLNALRSFLQFFADAINNVARAVGAGNVIGSVGIGNIPYLAQGTANFQGGPAIVGERGRELVMMPRGASVLPNQETEQLLRSGMLGPLIPGFAGGTGDPLGDLVGWFTGGAGNVFNHIFSASLHFSGAMEQVASSLMGMVSKWGMDKIGAMMGKYMADLAASAANAVSGVLGFVGGAVSGNLAGWMTSAIQLTGVPMSWLSALETIAQYESGGNPLAANNWDSNAMNGTPSVGLMQTIGPTFAAYALAGHGNIWNPIDNAAAAIRYIQSRYGSVFNVPGIASLAHGGPYVGYANGGIINEQITGIGQSGQMYRFGERGPETVTPGRTSTLEEIRDELRQMNRYGSHPLDQQRIIQALGPLLANDLRNNLGVRR